MVPYLHRTCDFPGQVLSKKSEEFLSALYSSFSHLFKTIDFLFAFSTELQQLFSKLQAARLKQEFVTKKAFDRLRQKFKIWFLRKLVLTKLTLKVLTKPFLMRRNLGTRTRPSAPECPALCRVWGVQLWEHSHCRLKHQLFLLGPC